MDFFTEGLMRETCQSLPLSYFKPSANEVVLGGLRLGDQLSSLFTLVVDALSSLVERAKEVN